MRRVVRPNLMTRKIGLDVVRAVAIGLVLISHFNKKLEFLGFPGVELFFALSGFLIGGILYRALKTSPGWSFDDVKRFWLRRWWRTLPNYYLFLVVSLFFHYHSGGLPTLVGFLPFLVFCQNLLRGGPGFYDVSWSLCVEEWFYLLFPLTILIFTSLHFSKRNAFICTTVLFLIFPPALREWMFATADPATIRKIALPRLDAIFYGVATSFVLARYRITPLQKRVLLVAAILGLVTLAFLQYYCFRSGSLIPFYRLAFFALPVCFSLTLPFFASMDRLPKFFSFLENPITKVSLWSYSIYLSHIPILFITYEVFGAAREHPAINILSKVTGLAICLLISRSIYVYYESKLTLLRPDERHSVAPVGLG